MIKLVYCLWMYFWSERFLIRHFNSNNRFCLATAIPSCPGWFLIFAGNFQIICFYALWFMYCYCKRVFNWKLNSFGNAYFVDWVIFCKCVCRNSHTLVFSIKYKLYLYFIFLYFCTLPIAPFTNLSLKFINSITCADILNLHVLVLAFFSGNNGPLHRSMGSNAGDMHAMPLIYNNYKNQPDKIILQQFHCLELLKDELICFFWWFSFFQF